MKPLLSRRPSGRLLNCFLLAWVACAALADAAVTGRYVRLEAPASGRMAPHEIEVFAGAQNLGRAAVGLKFSGTGYKGRNLNFRNAALQPGRLVGSKRKPTSRAKKK